jgi:uncharacterized membrane protein
MSVTSGGEATMTVNPGFGQYGPVGDARAQLRATTADRDRAVELLQRAYSEGRLSKEEFDSRSERALTAVSFTDLDVLVRDLTTPGPAQAWGPMYVGPAARTNALAITSLCCGIAQLIFGIFSGIPAIIFGHIARRQIRETGEQGNGMATAGIVLGWVGVALTALVVVFLIVFAAAIFHAAQQTGVQGG